MELKAKLSNIGKAMRDKSLSVRKEIIEESAVKFNEDKLENGVTRLIHNHAVNKATLGQEILGLTRNTSNRRITQLVDEGVISEPYIYNRQHMFTLHQVHELMNHFGFKKYRDSCDPVVVCVGNYKGGVGKTTTTTSLATKTALDLNLNAKVLIIDLDPQGSARGMMTVSGEDEVFITISDLLRAPFEESYLDSDNEAKAFLDEGHDFKDVVLAAPFNTHIPNLDVITAFPTDENFTKLYWSLDEEQRKELLVQFSTKVVPILKEEYDIIFLDLPPQNSPITWSALEASDMLLTPITPRTYDYVSTYSYFLTLPDYLESMPSKGENIRWFKMLPVNYNENNRQERKTYNRLLETVGGDMIITPIKHSPFFHEAAEKHRTIYDIIRSESMCTDIQFYDAINSVNEAYNTFIASLRTFASKQNSELENGSELESKEL